MFFNNAKIRISNIYGFSCSNRALILRDVKTEWTVPRTNHVSAKLTFVVLENMLKVFFQLIVQKRDHKENEIVES
jgi:hypothetical protein